MLQEHSLILEAYICMVCGFGGFTLRVYDVHPECFGLMTGRLVFKKYTKNDEYGISGICT